MFPSTASPATALTIAAMMSAEDIAAAGGQVDAEPLGLLGQAQGVGGGGGDHRGPEVDDLPDPPLGGLGAAGYAR